MRRFLLRFSSVVLGSRGSEAPIPLQVNLSAEMPLEIRY
jgi:hypothetical protein